MLNRYLPATPAVTALAILVVALATLVGAWILQTLGVQPCELCLQQRYAYYVGIPIAVVILAMARGAAPLSALKVGLGVVALIFAANAVLAFYHSGVELKLWTGPTACTGSIAETPGNASDLLAALDKVRVVRCDEVSFRIFGLSLANWNVLVSAALACVAARGVLHRNSL